jgi:hypothetical protein
MKQASVHVSTTNERRHEGEPVVQDSLAYPRGGPKSMIEAIAVSREAHNKVDQL